MRPDAGAFQGGRRLLVGAGVSTIVGAVLLGGVCLTEPSYAAPSYLAGWIFVASIPLGTLIFGMIVHTMKAGWPVLLRRLVEASSGTLPLVAVLFVPVLLRLGQLYPWAGRPWTGSGPDAEIAEVLAHQRPYLNPAFFTARAVGYLAIWIAVASLLRRWSLRQDATGAPVLESSQRILSAVALPAVGLSLTFAAFDWLMSLRAAWFSTIFGIYWFAGAILGGVACLTLLLAAADRSGLLAGLVGRSHYYALGRLLLTFVVFWAYVAFFQFFLIWMANRPNEVGWYLDRAAGQWAWFSVALALGHFAFPFVVLLSYRVKQRSGPLAVIAIWLLACHLLDSVWLVFPSTMGPASASMGLLGAMGAVLLVGGPTVALGVLRLRGHALVPVQAPGLEAALRYHSE